MNNHMNFFVYGSIFSRALKTKNSRRLIYISIGLLCFSPARADQFSGYDFNPPDVKIVDDIGVNLISGLPSFKHTPVSIGPSGAKLSLNLNFDSGWVGRPEFFNQMNGGLHQTKFLYNYGDPQESYHSPYDEMAIELLGATEIFRKINGAWVGPKQSGGSLVQNADGTFSYIDRSGAQYFFYQSIKAGKYTWKSYNGFVFDGISQSTQRVVFPDGRELFFSYVGTGVDAKLLSVTRNDGYQLRFTYDGAGKANSAVALNLAVDYCSPAAVNCTYSRPWPTATFSSIQTSGDWFNGTSDFTLTDSSKVLTRYTHGILNGTSRVINFKAGSSSSENTWNFSYYTMQHCVSNYTFWDCTPLRELVLTDAYRGTSNWHYSYTQPAHQAPSYTGLQAIWNTTAKAPGGFTTNISHHTKNGTTYSVTASNGSLTYETSDTNRVVEATDSEGRRFAFEYDGRGNVTKKTQIHASDSNQNIEYSAGFDAICNYRAKCNKPNWVRDPNGNQTDYVYDATHGGILKVTLPADSRGIRPETRYTYAQRYAWVKNGSGGYERGSAPIWVLIRENVCVDGPSKSGGIGCVFGAEVMTAYDYGPDSGPNNLLLRGTVVTAQEGSLRTCFAYDALGNKISETTPRAGLASCP